MASSKCVHCGADIDPVSANGCCVVCGKQPANTRSPGETPAAGMEEAAKRSKRIASQTLFGVAVFYLLFGIAALIMSAWLQPAEGEDSDSKTRRIIVRIMNLLVVPVFGGLGLWARRKPFAASLTGAILYGLLMVAILVAVPGLGLGVAIMFMILALLVSAVVVSAKARRPL